MKWLLVLLSVGVSHAPVREATVQPQPIVTGVRLEGATIFTRDDLAWLLKIREGSPLPASARSDGSRYYIRVLATLGTIAQKETTKASNAVFGEDDSTVSLASMGKMLFHAVLQVNDYLQSVSTDTRTRHIAGREVKAGVKLQ